MRYKRIEELRSRPEEFYERLFAKMLILGMKSAAVTVDGRKIRPCPPYWEQVYEVLGEKEGLVLHIRNGSIDHVLYNDLLSKQTSEEVYRRS